MFRNNFDTDCITWSPAGRIHQIEYAMEAVKQGAATVGLVSNTHAVVATVKRSSSELGSHQKKIFQIDQHLGIAIAGLVGDARVLAKYMRTECINHRFVYEDAMPVGRLVLKVADKSQVGTQRIGSRPYGVGLLVAGADATGPHLYETQPSGQYFEYKGMAIGARSQAARTYLEKHFEAFESLGLDELIRHGLLALRETLGSGGELSSSNISVGYVSRDSPFTIIEDESVQRHVDSIVGEAPAPAAADAPADAEMET